MTRCDVLAASAVAIIVAACGIVGSDYEPTDETFRKRVGTFISDKATSVDPIYGNVDVDSLFGKYVVNGVAPGEVLAEIRERATRAGWTLERPSAAGYEFHKRTNEAQPGYEIVRVICRGERPVTVYIAWLQTDGVASASEAKKSVEGAWATREFWPRFERAVASP